jgi:hypothetical protein
MIEINLGDSVEMNNGQILRIFMMDGDRWYGVMEPANFPRFLPEDEKIFVSRTKVKRIISTRKQSEVAGE